MSLDKLKEKILAAPFGRRYIDVVEDTGEDLQTYLPKLAAEYRKIHCGKPFAIIVEKFMVDNLHTIPDTISNTDHTKHTQTKPVVDLGVSTNETEIKETKWNSMLNIVKSIFKQNK